MIGTARLSIDISAGDAPPTEVLLLHGGINRSKQGEYLFDSTAAKMVMAAWQEHTAGLDHAGMIDLEHLSLDAEHPHFDPDSRAWYELELRGDDLWMVDIRWTADGAARLRDRRQRYCSPTFTFDRKNKRILSIHNVALTALPALHGAPELIAAASRGRDAMAEDTAAAAANVLKAMGLDPKMPSKVAVALGLDAGASLDEIRAALDSFASKMEQVEKLLAGDDSSSEESAPESAPEAAVASAPAAAPAEEKDQAVMRMRDEIASMRAELSARDAADRRDLVARLVACGSEMPATAWADDAATVPAEPWASMPVSALRARVARVTSLRVASTVAAPASDGLTDRQRDRAKRYGITPEKYLMELRKSGRAS